MHAICLTLLNKHFSSETSQKTKTCLINTMHNQNSGNLKYNSDVKSTRVCTLFGITLNTRS